ncbi:MAG: hypothetical protein AAGJ70_04270 [Pseudomonadota bacterium]
MSHNLLFALEFLIPSLLLLGFLGWQALKMRREVEAARREKKSSLAEGDGHQTPEHETRGSG